MKPTVETSTKTFLTQHERVLQWIDTRLPFRHTYRRCFSEYSGSKNLNGWHYFGVLAVIALIIQVVSGVFLAMAYQPNAALAFDSVEYIMREVPFGWWIRYMHSTGASLLFVVIYLHMFRGLLYSAYQAPRELVWIIGVLLFVCLMAEAFVGYVLPWGQMSYWGAQVIINAFSELPLIGKTLGTWIRGDYVVSGITLTRFFILHVVVLPFLLTGLVVLHLKAARAVHCSHVGDASMLSRRCDQHVYSDGVPFYPYCLVKYATVIIAFLIVFFGIVFFCPEMGGYFLEYANFVTADPLRTPEHMAPMWYFTPFYAILRANTYNFFGIEAKMWGIVSLWTAVLIWAFLPWLTRSLSLPVCKNRLYKAAIGLLAASFLSLGYLGMQPPSPQNIRYCQWSTIMYFGFFFSLPWLSRVYRWRTLPESTSC